MHGVGDLLTTALSVLSLATLAGLGLLRGTVVNLREQLKDSREETAALRATRADDQAERAEDHAKIARLSADLEAVGRVARGEAHWVAIGHQLEEHHEKATVHWERDEELLNRIVDELRREHG
jgi:hypothetical protein